MIVAEYIIETPFDLDVVATTIAGEQSSGTFVRVEGETDELRARAGAKVLSIVELESYSEPSLSSNYLNLKGISGPYKRAKIKIGFPQDNIGKNLPTLAATVTGNLYDLGELTGLRLINLKFPNSFRKLFAFPSAGVSGTRKQMDVQKRPFFGSIIKPNIGMNCEQIADLVETLCEAGVDFIKDDEICANPIHAPLKERIPAVMSRVRKYQDKTGRKIMIAFNITDETDAMRRHADLIQNEGGNCAMVSMNWVGLSALQSLRASTPLMLHGHRNGFGGMSRCAALGMSALAYQALYRLTGLDHMHVHGMGGKFCDDDAEVASAARDCLTPLSDLNDDVVLPIFSSGQWAGTLPATQKATQSNDFMFLSGGGILAHPDGPKAGVTSLHEAWEAISAGKSLGEYAVNGSALYKALEFYGD